MTKNNRFPKLAALVLAGGFAGALGMGGFASVANAQATVNSIAGAIKAQCDVITYEDDCLAAMTKGIRDAAAFTDADKATLWVLIRSYKTKHAYLAPRIDEVLTAANIPLVDPAA